jgi:hypothetical protein
MNTEPEKTTLKVVDRRRFDAKGELREDAQEAAYQPPVIVNSKADAPEKTESGEQPLTFIGFVASLATNALAAMGLLPEATKQGMPVSMKLAKEYIDIIEILQDKSRGNLTSEEAQMMTRVISDLKMQYVQAQNQGGMKK